MREQVEKILAEKIRPALQMDGGDIELVDVDESSGNVTVKLKGACGGCPMSAMTLVGFVEKTLKEEVPEVKTVTPAL
jgi:Fe-S cluster biogenesis protein NfuA